MPQPGEVFVGLGRGAGIDDFIAAKKVGPAARAIGIDMRGRMLDVARANHPIVARNLGPDIVQFHEGFLESPLIEPKSADIVSEREVPTSRRTSPDLWGECNSVTVKRWKLEKHAGRSFIGQRAVYHGPMKAAIDEEGHTFPRGVAVGICTDTVFKLRSPACAGSFSVIEPGADSVNFLSAGCCAPDDGCCREAA